MGIKNIFASIVYGAAVTLGAIGVQKGIEIANDPYKRAKVKKFFGNIKNDLKNKMEG